MKQLTIAAVKTSKALLEKMGRGGSFPGSIALKLDKDILKKIDINGPVILVTGTNGKTSTANMIADLMEQAGYRTVTNRKGDNLQAGVITALLSNTGLNGKLKADAAVLEVDELNIRHILPKLPVTALVVNNFFRDQLDRAREMEQLIESIEKVLPDFQGTLILNGNDPNVYRLKDKAPKAKTVTFGLDRHKGSTETSAEASEGKFCPRCGHKLEYEYYQYSHIGKFHCPSCGFATPELDINAKPDVDANTFAVDGHTYKSPYQGLYSMYNCAAVLAVAKEENIQPEVAEKVFAHAPQPSGRNETFRTRNGRTILNLIKNPTGANEVMKVIEQDKSPKQIAIVLNDHEQDGRDVSWIYDTHFEKLMDETTTGIWCSGTRSGDMALRIKNGGWNGDIHVVPSLEEAVKKAMDAGDNLYVISTYTALVPSRAAIKKEGQA